MLRLERPNMAINDPRCNTRYQMWNTWNIQATESREHLLGWTGIVANGAPGGKLKNLIIHCHGSPGAMALGQGFDRSNVEMFSRLRGKVNAIWLHVCLVARIGTPGGTSDGNLFVCAMAKAAGCYVIAGTALQTHLANHTYPPDYVDSFEGTLLCYGPDGAVAWARSYGDWNTNRE